MSTYDGAQSCLLRVSSISRIWAPNTEHRCLTLLPLDQKFVALILDLPMSNLKEDEIKSNVLILNNVLLIYINLLIMVFNLNWLLILYILRRPIEFDEIFVT